MSCDLSKAFDNFEGNTDYFCQTDKIHKQSPRGPSMESLEQGTPCDCRGYPVPHVLTAPANDTKIKKPIVAVRLPPPSLGVLPFTQKIFRQPIPENS